MKDISDLVVRFIQTQEEADRLCKRCRRMTDDPSQAARCRSEAEAKQNEADSLLEEYQRSKNPKEVSSLGRSC